MTTSRRGERSPRSSSPKGESHRGAVQTSAVLLAALCAAACGGRRVDRDEATLLGAIVGVSASELQLAIVPGRLAETARDVAATDPVSQKLGLAECLLVQTQAASLGREAVAILPLLGPRPPELSSVAADLQATVRCGNGALFDAARLGKVLTHDVAEVRAMLARVHPRGAQSGTPPPLGGSVRTAPPGR